MAQGLTQINASRSHTEYLFCFARCVSHLRGQYEQDGNTALQTPLVGIMYEPSGSRAPNLAFLWPAFAAAATSDMAAMVAAQFARLAIGPDSPPASEPEWATPHKIALELKTVRLRDFSKAARGGNVALICAPFALHSAVIADFAAGHSLVAALRKAGLGRLFVTDWRSATAKMQYFGIDDYLAVLNILVDEIGAPVDLIGLCQGGFLALVYAARFPAKVRKLVLAGAPVDIAAAPSPLTLIADNSPLALFHEVLRLGDGLVPGRKIEKFWGPESVAPENIRELLQTDAKPGSVEFERLGDSFRKWHRWTLDLPGAFFIETVEKLYRRNELASGQFVALGRRIDLKTIRAPLFLLAGTEDELVAPAQLFAAEHLVGTAHEQMGKIETPCRHVALFMGRKNLEQIWPRIARWLTAPRDTRAEPSQRESLHAQH